MTHHSGAAVASAPARFHDAPRFAAPALTPVGERARSQQCDVEAAASVRTTGGAR
ncbi:hypothetical protein Snas_5489 [Stackebrandtia nassauensis DSM 44728]|uniref:Uncharacterized protein n=1 Tax=Stackebrandtia nassauensis (strain DSM 44728 / CIP 108903 / NRRL B-16338 / NBRC 102104 / LLR-40K-21) TaxID=446470 RepID=D3PVZ9_STANL|nr:hypothetical protein Snas_5489 [Stackebrandtia nassauensis DSM 44728]